MSKNQMNDPMIKTKVKRRYVMVKVEVTRLERFRPIEIRLPSNITRITGLLVTASVKDFPQP